MTSTLRERLFRVLTEGAVKESDGAPWPYDAVEAGAICDAIEQFVLSELAAHNRSCWCPVCHEPSNHGCVTELAEKDAEIERLNGIIARLSPDSVYKVPQ